MAGLKEIKNRLESVQSTGQLTAAMKMVSASKLRKAQKKMIALRSFAYQMTELYKVINSGLEENAEAMLILKGRPIQRKVLIIVITSNKGLCGSFNVNVCKAAEEYIAEKYAKLKAEGSLEILCLGNKGAEYYGFR
ncbi:MAG: F0F1 ATP synthase subunit gamma, partial [Bacteroidales bacterium]